MTSLCPKLGKMHAEEFKGSCPSHMQDPFGKTVNISYIGTPPYIIHNPLGGSDILVTKILAHKFSFIPKFILAKSFDTHEDTIATSSMIHQV